MQTYLRLRCRRSATRSAGRSRARRCRGSRSAGGHGSGSVRLLLLLLLQLSRDFVLRGHGHRVVVVQLPGAGGGGRLPVGRRSRARPELGVGKKYVGMKNIPHTVGGIKMGDRKGKGIAMETPPPPSCAITGFSSSEAPSKAHNRERKKRTEAEEKNTKQSPLETYPPF